MDGMSNWPWHVTPWRAQRSRGLPPHKSQRFYLDLLQMELCPKAVGGYWLCVERHLQVHFLHGPISGRCYSYIAR